MASQGFAEAAVQSNPMAGHGLTAKNRGGKFLTFFLGGEEYGLEILKVQEIIGMQPVTRVPRTPASVRGVINLRGKIIPIIDLRMKFGMESTEETAETCIIVVEAHGIKIGTVVDRVSEVLDIVPEAIEDTPDFGSAVETHYIMGIGKSEGRVKILLHIDRVLSDREASDLRAVPEAAQAEIDAETSVS